MTPGTILALLVAGAGLAFVIAPLFRRDAAEVEQQSSELSAARELQSRRDMLLAALKDLEDDRATDKIGDADYKELETRLSGQAIEVMQRLDVLEKDRDDATEAARRAARPLRHPGAKRSDRPR